ncbi:MAG: hypothetical protein A3F11_09940 [Gammaproteobacteria bacterium RIFCSPHIGHO2_12_FULL_37_14]|nr:MAG: hypothetical protein A3F11_09940 [Gammaproteobacteria bacterium RIFCSPHIGHO2_12_FULL_37_14]
MILLFIKSYLYIFTVVGLSAIIIFLIGLFIIVKIFRSPHQHTISQASNQKIQHSKIQITSSDIRAIAGGDTIATQLDLARAYIEVGKKQLAKKMLDHIIQKGNGTQQQQAKNLLGLLI